MAARPGAAAARPSSTRSSAPSVGKRDALELVLLGLLADGHVLIEDYPGLAKTLIARSFAQTLALASPASSSRPT